ncbi:uridylate kinase [Pycnococcus provasolii]
MLPLHRSSLAFGSRRHTCLAASSSASSPSRALGSQKNASKKLKKGGDAQKKDAHVKKKKTIIHARQQQNTGSSSRIQTQSDALATNNAANSTTGNNKANNRWKRILLKVSGEALQGEQGFGICPDTIQAVARQVAQVASEGVEVSIVVGGGNFFRGASAYSGIDRASADYMGMLATVMNAMALQAAVESCGVPTRVQTALEIKECAEPYIRRKAVRHLERGRVVIFGGGTGNPYFTTDTAAALRAAEIDAEVFLKATKVNGVYDKDPEKHADAEHIRFLSYRDVTFDELGVMDATAVTLCKENNIPIVVFSLLGEPDSITRLVCRGERIGTCVGHKAEESCFVDRKSVGDFDWTDGES